MCDVTKRRFKCACPPGYTGHRCQIALPPRSCKDVMIFNKVKANGIYIVMDQQDKPFPVFCDFASEPGAAWTLIQSHSLQNNSVFKRKAFYLHDMPIKQDAPEWNSYRLSMSRMMSIRDVSTHWRATCNFSTDGVDYRDYWRVSLDNLDILVAPSNNEFCLSTEFVNVHGLECSNCTVLVGYSSVRSLHLDNYYGPSKGCDLGGGIDNEDNFGFYDAINSDFRCTASMSSTTQVWFGRF